MSILSKFLLVSFNVFVIAFYLNVALEASKSQHESAKSVKKTKHVIELKEYLKWKNISHAVIHLGPHKTATTSIQAACMKYEQQLGEDGYGLPFRGFTASTGIKLRAEKNQMNFATCFIDDEEYDTIAEYCEPKLLKYAARKDNDQKNIFLTSEAFSQMDAIGIKQLSKYVTRRWDQVTFIVYYRR